MAPVSRYCVKLRRWYFQFLDFWSILITENCQNSRISDDIVMKLEPVTKIDERNKVTSQKIDDYVISENFDFIAIFGFLVNLQQSGSWIPDTECAKVMCSVIVTFCLTKTANRTKTSLTQLSHYCFE